MTSDHDSTRRNVMTALAALPLGAATAANAQSGIDATRELANDALDKASSRVTTLRDDMQPAIEAVSSRVQDMAARGMAAAAETRDLAREKLAEASDHTSAYVAEKPFKAMALAAAAGALLAMLWRRR